MAKIKYYYDTESCQYQRVKIAPKEWLLNTLGFLVISAFFGALCLLVYLRFFDSPKEAVLRKQNDELKQYYELMNRQFTSADRVLKDLQERDDNIYRVIFEAKPLSASMRQAGVGGVDRYKDLVEGSAEHEQLISATMERLDMLRKHIYIQSKSYDEIVQLVKRKEVMLSSIPAIQPISNKTLKMLASGFGMRIHPIYKVKKFHAGIDFSAVRGTPVYATGDGVVYLPASNEGYGNVIEINHGFGFMTRYGHLDRIKIKNGQKIKRGEVIGYVGSTGTATAPHLHYEVHKNGNPVDPVHYFFNDLNAREYEEILRLSAVENQSLG